MKRHLFLSCLLVCGLFGSLVSADEITYELNTVASGSLGGVQFTNQGLTIRAVGDTDNVTTSGSLNLLNVDVLVSVEIVGLGSAEFTDAVQVVSNNNSDLGGFGNTSTSSGLIFINATEFETYDLRSEIGPVSGTAIINGGTHGTDGGNLFLISSTTTGTFEARFSAIPEPGSAVVFVLMTSAAAMRRQNRVV